MTELEKDFFVEKILHFNNQQKGKGRSLMLALNPSDLARVAHVTKVYDHVSLKKLTSNQMLQRLPIALGQVKAPNTSENLLNEIRQIIFFCIEKKKLLKKYIII